MQTILYSSKKPGKARKYKVKWMMELPDEWLAYDKVPKDLRDVFETRNRRRKDVQKKLNLHQIRCLTVQYLRLSKMRYKNRFSFFT